MIFTRRDSTRKLSTISLWCTGPHWFNCEENEWPPPRRPRAIELTSSVTEESPQMKSSLQVVMHNELLLLDINKRSFIVQLRNVKAWILRVASEQ